MDFPQAIYFDTNALRQAGEFLDQGAMPRLLDQARDFGIPLHVPLLVWGERIKDLTTRLRSRIGSAREFNRSVGENVIPRKSLDESKLMRSMEEVQKRGFC